MDKNQVNTAELNYKLIFESVQGMYLILSTDLVILQASNDYLGITLTKRKDIIGKDLFQVFPEKPNENTATCVYNLRTSLNFVRKNKISHTMSVQKYDILRRDGTFEERYWSQINSPVLNSKKEIQYIIHRIQDVTNFVLLQMQQIKEGKDSEDQKAHIREMEIEMIKRSKEVQKLNKQHEQKVIERTRELEKSNKDIADYKYALEESTILSITDEKGIIQYVNDNFCKIGKYKREELIGQNHRIINSGYHSKEFFKDLWSTITSGKIWRGEVRNKAKDESFYWVDATVVPFLNTKGKPYKYLAIRSDITERVRYIDELKLSKKVYMDLYENSLVSIITTDMNNFKPISVNDVAVELFGYKSKEEFLEKFDPTFHFANPIEMEDNIKNADENSQMKNKLFEMKRKDGTHFWAKLFVKLNSSNNIAQTVIIDVTEQVQSREKLANKVRELESSNKELESFNYVASHDLQEPLRQTMNFVSMLLRNEQKNLTEEGRDYLERMTNTTHQMRILIQDLLAYSRTKNAERNFEMTDLNALLEIVLTNFNDLIKEKHITIKCELLCEINIIRFQIQQLLSNLISNSIKFSHPERPLQINIKSEKVLGDKLQEPKLLPKLKYCHITFQDNGIGFEPEFNDRIFEIFERLHGKEKYSGTGIGLAICRRIVENHNGQITASGILDKGARFDIYIPFT